MGARLVHIAGGRRLSVTPLQGGDLVVGRDPAACAVVIESARVSRQHLLVRSAREGWVASDLGSANGTTLNGVPLAEPTLLSPGDTLDLAGEARFAFELTEGVYEGTQVVHGAVQASLPGEEGEEERDGEDESEETSPAARAVVIGLGAALLIVAAVLLWRAVRPDDVVYVEATQIAAEGLEAAEKREWALSKKKLKSAARVLYVNERLTDVPREQIMRVAMEQLGERLSDQLDREVDLASIYRNAIDATVFAELPPVPVEEAKAVAKAACRLDELPPEKLRDCIRERVGLFLVMLRQSPDGVPSWFYDSVGRRMSAEHDFFERSFRRGERFVPMMKDELRRAKMPEMLHYLSMIESGYQTDIGSHAGAVGLWQFMPATARRYGLRVDGRLDDRTDPRRSTQKAAEYLNDLAQEFGADELMLVLAGYNKGENGIRAKLREGDDPFEDRSYWHLVETDRLPAETALYVARFVAAGVAGEGGLPSKETLEAAGFKSP